MTHANHYEAAPQYGSEGQSREAASFGSYPMNVFSREADLGQPSEVSAFGALGQRNSDFRPSGRLQKSAIDRELVANRCFCS
jgi:hypothetical protein